MGLPPVSGLARGGGRLGSPAVSTLAHVVETVLVPSLVFCRAQGGEGVEVSLWGPL